MPMGRPSTRPRLPPLPRHPGGQRIRVGIARAAYAAFAGEASILLLDDPLAGVDPAGAAAIMRDLLGGGGLLEGKTRIVAVSDPALLPQFDQVVSLQVGLG
jgi:ABC-type Mn2+/Zn2+ transport system ATPase subunit